MKYTIPLCIILCLIILLFMYLYFRRNSVKNSGALTKEEFIPKIIHQTWKTKKLPDNFQRWSSECKRLHNEWQHYVWTDKENREFIAKHYPWFLETYDSYNVNIKRVDAVRYFLLYHYGGVYLDMDFVCLKRLEPLTKEGKAIFGYQRPEKDSVGAIANAFMAAPPRHPLFKMLIANLKSTKDLPVLQATGPQYLTKILREYKGKDVKVYEMPLIYPVVWNDKDPKLKDCEKDVEKCRKNFPRSFFATLWTGSWIGKP